MEPAGLLYYVNLSTSPTDGREVEIKLKVASPRRIRMLLKQSGFRISAHRAHELNLVYDTAGGTLRRAGILLRLRACGKRHKLTFKGPAEEEAGAGGPSAPRYKIREEIEMHVPDAAAFRRILSRLGFEPAFVYEKFRTEYACARGGGHAMVDETPAGVFLELEGPPKWIDSTARKLGFSEQDYITKTYAQLHAASGSRERDMLFHGERP